MKKILLLLLAAFPVLTANAQSRKEKIITGKVLSMQDSVPLHGASVTIAGTTYGTGTNMMGDFSLKVKTDTVTLEIRFMGYLTATRKIAAHDNNITVRLREDSRSLQEIIVMSDSPVQKKAMVAASVSALYGSRAPLGLINYEQNTNEFSRIS